MILYCEQVVFEQPQNNIFSGFVQMDMSNDTTTGQQDSRGESTSRNDRVGHSQNKRKCSEDSDEQELADIWGAASAGAGHRKRSHDRMSNGERVDTQSAAKRQHVASRQRPRPSVYLWQDAHVGARVVIPHRMHFLCKWIKRSPEYLSQVPVRQNLVHFPDREILQVMDEHISQSGTITGITQKDERMMFSVTLDNPWKDTFLCFRVSFDVLDSSGRTIAGKSEGSG